MMMYNGEACIPEATYRLMQLTEVWREPEHNFVLYNYVGCSLKALPQNQVRCLVYMAKGHYNLCLQNMLSGSNNVTRD